jgi:hypothetical protein
MSGPAPSHFRAADLVSSGGQEPLPARPLLTTPPDLQRSAFADLQRQHLAAQPWLGVGGLLLGAVVFFALALGLGSTEASLLVLGPLATFALPAVAMIAFWWNDWPGSQLTTPWAGLIDTVLVVGSAVVLTPWPGPRSPRCSSCRWSASAGRWPASGGCAPGSPPWPWPGGSASAPTSCS